MKAILSEGIRRVRPALAAAIARITSLNKREFVHTKHGIFFLNPLSYLAFHLRHSEYQSSATTTVLPHPTFAMNFC